MGGLLAFRVGNYDNTAEREQFRFLCQQLKTHFENSGNFCVFVGNYNIGCELDALFIKKDAIISIEFKNYGGKIVANENGEWTADGVTIKGGSRKTVLQQARINHSTVKCELKALGIDDKQIKDVPHLVVFHQPIELENRLSATNKSWLHITDDIHFIEKLEDITCPKTDLDPLGIVNLAELLNLNSFYLTEFSNASYDSQSKKEQNIAEFKEIKTDSKSDTKNETQTVRTETTSDHNGENAPDDNPINENEQQQSSAIQQECYNEEQKELIVFVRNVLSTILKNEDYEIELYDSNAFLSAFMLRENSSSKTHIVAVRANRIEVLSQKISKFIGKEVQAVNSNIIYWEEGADACNITSFPPQHINEAIQQVHDHEETTKSNKVVFRKSKTVLPHWLDKYIFDTLGAEYSPEHTRYEYNLDLSAEEAVIYLGTYFPRSYSEAFCIFDNLLRNDCYLRKIENHCSVNILDVGCGTGGELIGLITALAKYLPKPMSINIDACDGNQYSLRILEKIVSMMQSQTHHTIILTIHLQKFLHNTKINTTQGESRSYDYIFCDKVVCELMSHNVITDNAYKKVANSLCPLLTDDGILLILDVTTKDENKGLFYPQIMNRELNSFVNDHHEISTLLPLACSNSQCVEACFMQQTFYINHSRKSSDESRVCYRMLCHNELKEKILPNIDVNAQHIIHPLKYMDGDESGKCSKLQGNKIIDSFNINQ